MGTLLRNILKRFHPEGIPWPASIIYNAVSSTEVFHRHYELVAHEVAQFIKRGRILDIGTGPGHLLLSIHKAIPDAKIVGVDISPAMISEAQQNFKKNNLDQTIELKVAGASALPFADETFDCIVSTGSFHHWKDPVQSLSEAYRVLKKGGQALIYDLVRKMPEELCNEVRAQFGSFRLALLWLHSFEEPFLNAEEMIELGKETAFIVKGTKYTGALCCLVLAKNKK